MRAISDHVLHWVHDLQKTESKQKKMKQVSTNRPRENSWAVCKGRCRPFLFLATLFSPSFSLQRKPRSPPFIWPKESKSYCVYFPKQTRLSLFLLPQIFFNLSPNFLQHFKTANSKKKLNRSFYFLLRSC